FDLMFDVQARGEPSGAAIESIAAYYRRVTTDAHPMSRLVAAAMLVTIGALVAEVIADDVAKGAAIASLVLTITAGGLAAARTVRNAVRLGTQADPPDEQRTLARSILRDHLVCFAAIATTLVIQVAS